MTPTLVIGVGKPKGGDDMREQSKPEGAGPVACRAFCKAQQAAMQSGDYGPCWEAFKEMLQTADDEIGPDSPDTDAPYESAPDGDEA